MPDSLISSVLWQGGALPLMELATLWRTTSGHALHGSVVGALDGTALAVRYRVACTKAWETRSVHVEVESPPEVREIWIHVDESGAWTIDGIQRPDLRGVTDVDIQVTPSTNALPIRRLGLKVGERAEVTAAWVQLPALLVSPLMQSYERVAPNRYEYRAGDFRAELVLAEDGLVERYGSFWRRLSHGASGWADDGLQG